MKTTDHGSATIAALFATLLLLTVASATWSVALASHREAFAGHAAAETEAAAEAVVRRYAAGTSTQPQLALGASRPLGSFALARRVQARGTVVRVGRELYVLRGEGRQSAPATQSIVGFVVWALNPTARLGAAGGVVSSAGSIQVGPGGSIRSDSTNQTPPGWGSACAPVMPAADSVLPGGVLARVSYDTTAAVRLGRLDQSWLLANSTVHAPGTVTPAPRSGPSGCVTSDPANWGDPSGSGACSGHRPLIAASNDLVVSGGVGQGVLVVPGNLRMTAGAQFFGVVLVGGGLRVDGGARITGIARAGGGATISGGTISGSSCAVLLALSLSHLNVTLPIPDAWVDPL